jgi:hypothetical protein
MSLYAHHQVAEAKAAVTLSRIVGETTKLTKAGPNRWVAECPFHGEKTPSLSVYADHFHCFGCNAHGDAVAWLMKARKMTFCAAMAHLGATPAGGRPQAIQPPPQTPPAPARSATLDAARRVWTEARDPKGTIVEIYLASRGLSLPEAAPIRFHPACQRGPRDAKGVVTFAAAMICLMRDPLTDQPTGVHRTFLTASGCKAPPSGDLAPPAKSILGRWGSIRIPSEDGTSSDSLGISEGLENGLSAKLLLGWQGAVWATGCQASLTSFPVLQSINALSIFADGDPVGMRAANACATRWREAGRHVEIHIPPAGDDWNSQLLQRIGC